MEGKFSFYTYGAVLELNGVAFAAGQLAADMLNLSREKYLSIFGRMVQIQKLSETYDETCDVEVWWKLNNLMYTIFCTLKKYKVFQFLLGEDEEQYFTTVREVTGQYGLLPPVEAPRIEDQIEQEVKEIAEGFLSLNFVDEVSPPALPFDYGQAAIQEPLVTLEMRSALLEHYGVNKEAWVDYKKTIARYRRYLLDVYAFDATIRNFISIVLSKLERNDTESYAAGLYDFYNSDRLIEKLMVRPIENFGVGYNRHDEYALSYVPRLLPDGAAVIAQEHVTDSVQALLKADYMLALNSGHQIRRCLVCGRYFLLKSGVHALYCEGACPHAPRYTCRQFGSHEVQKELAKDIPKVRAKLKAFERITKDFRRDNITRADARRAKDYVRDILYDALRDPKVSLEAFEAQVTSEEVYSACGIYRATKQRGRPRKKDGETA